MSPCLVWEGVILVPGSPNLNTWLQVAQVALLCALLGQNGVSCHLCAWEISGVSH